METPKAITTEEALERIPLGLFQWRLLIMCGGAFMADSLEVNLLTFLATCVGDEWNLSDTEEASITGIVFVGIIIGTIFWGVFADWYGRRLTYLIACILVSVFGFISGASPNFYWLIAFRSVTGFGLGAMDIPFDLLAEFMPDDQRGKFLIYITYFWTIGSLLVTGLAWAYLSSDGWRLLVYSTAVPVAVICAFSLWYLPESPRWLLVKGRREEAERVIREAAAVNGVELEPFVLITEEGLASEAATSAAPTLETPVVAAAGNGNGNGGGYDEGDAAWGNGSSGGGSSGGGGVRAGMGAGATAGGGEEDATYWELLQDPAARKVNGPIWITWLMFGFTYYGIILFVGRLYEKKNDDNESCSFNYADVFYNAASEFVGCTLALLCIDSWGRRYTQGVFYAISGFSVFLMGFETNAIFVLIVGMMARLTNKTALSATWVMTPELYSTSMRTVGHSLCFALSKAGAFCSPYLVSSNASPATVGIALGISCIIGATSAMFLPETKGKLPTSAKTAVATSNSNSSSSERGVENSSNHSSSNSSNCAAVYAAVTTASLSLLDATGNISQMLNSWNDYYSSYTYSALSTTASSAPPPPPHGNSSSSSSSCSANNVTNIHINDVNITGIQMDNLDAATVCSDDDRGGVGGGRRRSSILSDDRSSGGRRSAGAGANEDDDEKGSKGLLGMTTRSST